MGRMKKLIDFKPLKSVKYHKERHHICMNTAICKRVISPSEVCEGCKHYQYREVDVADNPIRHSLDWGF